MTDKIEVIKEGTWLYDGSIKLKVQIIKSHIIYGSGDYEDPPEIQNDKVIENYKIQYESTIKRNYFQTGCGGFLTLEEAIKEVEIKTNNTVTWK